MSTSDFCVKIDCGEDGKQTTLYFRYSSKEGAAPILCGAESEFQEFSVNVSKTLKPAPEKRKRVTEVEYRRVKREIFYDEEAEEDSTEYTYDE